MIIVHAVYIGTSRHDTSSSRKKLKPRAIFTDEAEASKFAKGLGDGEWSKDGVVEDLIIWDSVMERDGHIKHTKDLLLQKQKKQLEDKLEHVNKQLGEEA